MKNQAQAESKLNQCQEQLERLKKNGVLKAVDPVAYEWEYRSLSGQIYALEWVLEIKKTIGK